MACGHDCFHCPYDDCIDDDITLEELKRIDPGLEAGGPVTLKQIDQKEWRRQYDRTYRSANKEKISEQTKMYREKNREEINRRQKGYREKRKKKAEEDPELAEEIRQKNRERRERHRRKKKGETDG